MTAWRRLEEWTRADVWLELQRRLLAELGLRGKNGLLPRLYRLLVRARLDKGLSRAKPDG
jgi:hypothetical protein